MDDFEFDSETASGLDAGLGAAEQRTEPYMQYGERAAQAGTTPSAKNIVSASSFAGWQYDMARAVSVVEHTGFPNPATDSNIVSLDLTRLLIKHPSSTFFMRLSGNSWESLGVFDGDLAIIDKAIEPRAQDTVVWWNSSEFCISKYNRLPEDIAPWGVVTSIIHRYHT